MEGMNIQGKNSLEGMSTLKNDMEGMNIQYIILKKMKGIPT